MDKPVIQSGYFCKECGAPAVIKDGKVIRTCKHSNSPVIAPMEAVATGEGKAST